MRGGICCIVELVPASATATDSFVMQSQANFHCQERFVAASQIVETRCYRTDAFAAAVKTYGKALEYQLLTLAHLSPTPAVGGGGGDAGHFCATWGNGGIISVINTCTGKWYVTHPLDEDKLFDRHHGFLAPAAQQRGPLAAEGLQKRVKK